MLTIKPLVAVVAIATALATSAFTNKPGVSNALVMDGYYANKDHNPNTEQSPSLNDQSEVNIDSEVALSGSFNSWEIIHCEAPFDIICAVLIINNSLVIVIYGTYVS